MFPFRRVLVALAGTGADCSLLDYAASLGQRSAGTEFRCVHVAASPEALERAAAVRERALDRLLLAARTNEVLCQVVRGEREDRLLEIAAEHRADVVLLGHRREHSGRRSLARRLAMKAPCSVWMVPDGAPAPPRHILVPVDFSQRSADAVGVGTALAASLGLEEAHALHVHFNESSVPCDEYDEIIAETHEKAFWLFAARIDLHGVDLKPLLLEGAIVARTILRVAAEQQFDLLVMGTRGRSRSAAILLGSETEHVIRETQVPVLAVKHFGARLRVLEALLERRFRSRGEARFT